MSWSSNFNEKRKWKRTSSCFEVQHVYENGWCNESVALISPKCNAIFTRGLPNRLEGFAHNWQIIFLYTAMGPSIPFHTLIKLVDAEDVINEKIRTLDLPLETYKVTSELEP